MGDGRRRRPGRRGGWGGGGGGKSLLGGPGGAVLDELCDGGVVSQGAPGRLHVRQLGHKLLYLSHRLSIVALLNSVREND